MLWRKLSDKHFATWDGAWKLTGAGILWSLRWKGQLHGVYLSVKEAMRAASEKQVVVHAPFVDLKEKVVDDMLKKLQFGILYGMGTSKLDEAWKNLLIPDDTVS